MKLMASTKLIWLFHNLWHYSTRKHAIIETNKLINLTNNIVIQQYNLFLHYLVKM